MATSTNIYFFIHDERATLIDFDGALQCDNAKVLEEEFRTLEKELSDTSGRGGHWQVVVTCAVAFRCVAVGAPPVRKAYYLTSIQPYRTMVRLLDIVMHSSLYIR